MEDAGFSAIPEFSPFFLLEGGDVVVFASDGIWDVMTTSDVLKVLRKPLKKAPWYQRETRGKELVEAAVRLWTVRYGRPTRADDISVILFEVPHDGSPAYG